MSNKPMRHMKILEITFWIVGATLLVVYTAAQSWGERERATGVAAYAASEWSIAESRVVGEPIEHVIAPADRAVTAPWRGEDTHAVLAVLRIPGIALEVPVNHGTTEGVLLRGAGLIEGTAPPGTPGNVAIAAHRDTFFRDFERLAVGDRIELDSRGSTRTYHVTALSVVEPTDVHVLADTAAPVLTLVTCYPFRFVGNAPQRFIVRAEADTFSL